MSNPERDYRDFLEEQELIRKISEESEVLVGRKRRLYTSLIFSAAGGVASAILINSLGPYIVGNYGPNISEFLSRWWANILIIPVTLGIGLGFYKFKKKARKWYGILETILGLGTASISISKIFTGGLLEVVALVAAVYFVVRGIDNVNASIDDLKLDQEVALLKERVNKPQQITFDQVSHALKNPSGPEAVRQRYER